MNIVKLWKNLPTSESWEWSSLLNRYVPGSNVIMSTYTELTNLSTTMGLGNDSNSIGVVVKLKNTLTPTQWTNMYWSGTQWAPVAGQILYGAYGTLLDMTASSLTLSAWNEVWQSPVLPDWFFKGVTISISVDAFLRDASSTPIEKLRASIRAESYTIGDESGALVSHSGSGTSVNRSLGGVRVRGRLSGGQIYGTTGQAAYNPMYPNINFCGTYNATTTRARMEAWPGAATNYIKLFSFEMWSGA